MGKLSASSLVASSFVGYLRRTFSQKIMQESQCNCYCANCRIRYKLCLNEWFVDKFLFIG